MKPDIVRADEFEVLFAVDVRIFGAAHSELIHEEVRNTLFDLRFWNKPKQLFGRHFPLVPLFKNRLDSLGFHKVRDHLRNFFPRFQGIVSVLNVNNGSV